MCHTASYYFWGKDPTYALGTGSAVRVSMPARINAWLYYGGGIDLMNEFFAHARPRRLPVRQYRRADGRLVPQGNQHVADLQGLKMRIGGFAGKVLNKLGVVPQQIAGGDIYPALEKGTIDAAEWVGPYDDEKLGFYKVAPYYYYPGWWEGGPTVHIMFNKAKFERTARQLPVACCARPAQAANANMLANYDYKNPAAIEALVARGRAVAPVQPGNPRCLLRGRHRRLCRNRRPPTRPSRRSGTSSMAFRKDDYLWAQIAEYNYDTFMMMQQRNGKL